MNLIEGGLLRERYKLAITTPLCYQKISVLFIFTTVRGYCLKLFTIPPEEKQPML